MNDSWLLVCFILFGLLALSLALYPLRKSKLLALILAPILAVVLSLAYWYWGAWPEWQSYVESQAKQRQVQAVMQTIKGSEELIQRLRVRLDKEPSSARGWYLLGRLYVSQGQWAEAGEAFAKAHSLNPEDEAATVNYGQALWQLNQRQFNEQTRKVFADLLEKNPQQPDALAMLAMDAFANHHYQAAIDYWQLLLKLAPEQSEEAQMIRKAIAKAQQKL